MGDLTGRQLGVLGGRRPAQFGDPVVYLDVHPRHLRGTRVLTDLGADALFYLLLLLAYALDVAMLLADQRSGGGIGVVSLGAGAVRTLWALWPPPPAVPIGVPLPQVWPRSPAGLPWSGAWGPVVPV